MRSFGFELAAVLAAFISPTHSATAVPPSYPLAVRSPYLSAWLPCDKSNNVPTANAKFWNGYDLTWKVAARVDGHTYALFGYHDNMHETKAATQLNITYSSTHTSVFLTAGGVKFNLDWFSPVSPNNNFRQSLPFSYLTVTLLPENAKDVQIIAGVNDNWIGSFQDKSENGKGGKHMGNDINKVVRPRRTDIKTHFTTVSNESKDYRASLFTSAHSKGPNFQEWYDIAVWGSLVWATEPSNDSELSYDCDNVEIVHEKFRGEGVLSTKIANGTCNPGDFLAFVYDHGKITKATSRTFAIGYDTDPTIQFGDRHYTRFWRSQIKSQSLSDATVQFLEDYSSAHEESLVLDKNIRAAAERSVSSKYADLVEAAVRQAYGAVELVVPSWNLDPDGPLAFLKEISSDSNIQTIDVVFPTFPIYWALSPQYLRYHLQTYHEFIAANASKLPYTFHDLGKKYPLAVGPDPNGEHLPLQSTSSFLTLHAVYELATNDTQWGKNVLPKLESYADYLRTYGMAARGQRSSVDVISPYAHQTSLAVQAAQALHAFGVFSGVERYTEAARNMSNELYRVGRGLDKNRTHFTFIMGTGHTWNVNSAAFTEKLLGLDTFPQEAWDMESDWYEQHVGPLGLPYVGGGIRLNHKEQNCSSFVVSEWNFFAAAAASKATQSKILDAQHNFFTSGVNPIPFPTRYCLDTERRGHYIICKARSTVGSVFAPMIINGKMKPGALGPPSGTTLGKRPAP